MFGALISCTDPISIINVLRELPSSKKFNVLLEGESLLNDAIGMIIYQIGSVYYLITLLFLNIKFIFRHSIEEQDILFSTSFTPF